MKSKIIESKGKWWMISLSFIIFSPAEAQQLWTLDECIDYAIAHNNEIAHRLNEQKRHEVKAQAVKDARLPRFTGDIGGYAGTLHHSDDHTKFDATESLFSMGLSGAVPLYTGGRLSSQIKAEQYALMAATEDVRTAEKNIKLQVAAAYLQVLYNKGEATIAQERLEVSQLLLNQARSLFDKGKQPESDTVEAAAIVSRDEALLTAAEGDIAQAMLDLRQLLNLPDSVRFDIGEPTDTISYLSPLTSYLSPITSHPAVQSAGYNILQAEQGLKAARSGYYPTLALVGEVGTFWANLDTDVSHSGQAALITPWGQLGNLNYYLSSETAWKRKNFLQGIVGLKLTIPIFDAFETKARISTAKVNLEDARLAYDDARQRIHKDISQAWQAAVTAHKRYEAEVKAEEASALAYRYALKRYDAGMATLYDLSQVRQQWFTATENALRMKYEYLIRKRILEILL
jgi:outer membrane protein